MGVKPAPQIFCSTEELEGEQALIGKLGGYDHSRALSVSDRVEADEQPIRLLGWSSAVNQRRQQGLHRCRRRIRASYRLWKRRRILAEGKYGRHFGVQEWRQASQRKVESLTPLPAKWKLRW